MGERLVNISRFLQFSEVLREGLSYFSIIMVALLDEPTKESFTLFLVTSKRIPLFIKDEWALWCPGLSKL